MLVLGIDPGTATTGYGLIKVQKTGLNVLDFGLIETDKNGEPSKRLAVIESKVMRLLKAHNPGVMAVEKLFFATNAKTAMRVGQAQGVILLCAAKKKIKVYEYAPGRIKKTISGDGRADKKKIQSSLRKILGAGVRSKKKKKTHFDNEADALAVALCHIIHMGGEIDGKT
jgi:crossover junction endodeoxyribonuclease RuvC